jgi:hypothetical protein
MTLSTDPSNEFLKIFATILQIITTPPFWVVLLIDGHKKHNKSHTRTTRQGGQSSNTGPAIQVICTQNLASKIIDINFSNR